MNTRKVVALANTPDEVSAVLRALRELERQGPIQPLLVVLNQGLATGLPSEITCRCLKDYAVDEELLKRTVLWVDEWADRPQIQGHSFKEILRVRDRTLWWFFLPVLFPDLMRCFQYIEAFDAVFQAEKPDLVVADICRRPMLPFRLNRAYDLPTRIAFLVACRRNYPVESVRQEWQGTVRFWGMYGRRWLLNQGYRLAGRRAMAWLRCRLWQWCCRRRSVEEEEKRKKLVLFSTCAYWRETGEVEGGVRCQNDVFAGAVLQLLAEQKGWKVLDVDTEVNLPSLANLRKFCRKVRRPEVVCRPLESYCDRHLEKGVRRNARHWVDLWDRWKSEPDVRQAFTYRQVPLWDLLEGRLEYLFRDYAETCLRHLEATAAVLRTEAPQVVLLEYEEGSYGRAATIAAQELGIPSVALQHGLHGGPHIPSYYFRRVCWEASQEPLACPVPTRTAVFGEDTKRMLTQVSAYPPEAVEVTGTPVYDILWRQQQCLSPEQIRRELGLDGGDKVVTITSSIFTEVQDRVWFVETVLTALKDLVEVKAIVKLHPHETPDLWQQTARRFGMENPLLSAGRLWDTIAAADVVVSWYSTTILDAMLLARPVIVLRIAGKSNPLRFIEEAGVRAVEDAGQLAMALKELLADEGARLELVSRSRALLQDQLHRLDGRAASRIVGLIEELRARSRKVAAEAVPTPGYGEVVS